MNKVMSVYKYEIGPGEQVLNLPREAEILTVQVQYGEPRLWALVEPNAPLEDRVIWVIGTGWQKEVPEGYGLVYISTFQLSGGSLIYHAFELV